MPLIDCPECGQKVASAASVCPRCSCFFGQRTAPKKSRITWPVPALVMVLLLVAILGIPERTSTDLGIPESTSTDLGIPKRIDTESQPLTSSTPAQLTPATVASPPTATPRTIDPSTQTKWTSTWVNVREGRGIDTRVVAVIDPAQRVEVDSLQGSWWVVYIDGRPIGYVANSVLQNESPSR